MISESSSASGSTNSSFVRSFFVSASSNIKESKLKGIFSPIFDKESDLKNLA